MKIKHSSLAVFIGLAATATLLAILTTNTAPILVIGIYFISLYLQLRLPKLTLVPALVGSAILYSTTFSLLAHLGYFASFGQAIPLTTYSFIIMALALFVSLRLNLKTTLRTGWEDLIHLAFIVLMITLMIGSLSGASLSKSVAFVRLGGTEDTSSQAQMYHYVIKENKFAYLNKEDQSGIRKSLTSYPQGAHAMIASLTQPFVNINKASSIFYGYVLGLTAMYIAMIYLPLAYTSYMLKSFSRSYRFGLNILAATTLLVLFGLGLLLTLYTHSFLGQIVAYLAIGAGLIIAYHAKVKDGRVGELLSASALVFFTVMTSWYLVAPLSLIAIFYVIVRNWQWLTKKLPLVLPAATLGLLLMGALAYTYLFTTTSTGHILTPGGSDKYSGWILLITAPLTTGLIVALLKKKPFSYLQLWGGLLTATLMTIAIALYQLYKINHLDYYYYKSLFTVIYVGLVTVVLALVPAYVAGTRERQSSKSPAFVYICLGAAIIVISNMPYVAAGYAAYQNMKFGAIEQQQPRLLDLAFNEKDKNYDDVIFMGSCDGGYLDFMGTIWSGMTHLDYLKDRGDYENQQRRPDDNEYLAATKKYLSLNPSKSIKVYVIDTCRSETVDYLARQSNVTIDRNHIGIQP